MNDRHAQDSIGDMSDIAPEKVEIRDRDEAVARSLKGPASVAATVIALLFSLFQLFTAYAGAFPDLIQRSIHMAFAIVLGFLMYSATSKSPRNRPSVVDVLSMILGLLVCGYAALNYDRIMMNPGISNIGDLVLGIIATVGLSTLMEHTGMGFVEAVKELASQAGMQVPEDGSRRRAELPRRTRRRRC